MKANEDHQNPLNMCPNSSPLDEEPASSNNDQQVNFEYVKKSKFQSYQYEIVYTSNLRR